VTHDVVVALVGLRHLVCVERDATDLAARAVGRDVDERDVGEPDLLAHHLVEGAGELHQDRVVGLDHAIGDVVAQQAGERRGAGLGHRLVHGVTRGD
jgi:hypothetical protein